MDKVIVAIDESEESFFALQWLLLNLDMKSLNIIHVLEPFPHYVFPGVQVVFPATSITQSANRVRRENAEALLAHAAHMCSRSARVKKANTSILEGDPKEMICEAAEEMHADLIVVGSRGLGKIKRAFLGSVSDYVVHHAKCPVLIVKPPDASPQ
ncbi:uncharacterized protein LOC142547960 [Primulina tabacum]|uniref:uncharacterized protein LOC142547960 n=1 Tax=Primulina tabacum TaxID=48773 RepID=UPI003F5997BE